MLQVSHGSFRLLEQAFLERVKRLQAGDKLAKIAVVAPSRHLADRLQRLVSLEGGIASLNIHFHTFNSLALAVLEDAEKVEAGGRKFLGDKVFHDRLLDSILDKHPELAARFGGEMRPRALASALRSSLKDLIDAGVDPEEVAEHFGDKLKTFPKLQALLELQTTYQAWQSRHKVFGSSGLPEWAAEAAHDSKLLASFKEILYYGFYDLTGRQLEFFEQVTSSYPSVLFFPYVAEHPAFRFAKDFFELKLHHGGSAPVNLETVSESFEAPDATGAEKEKLVVFNASGARDEVWKASKEILRLRREGVAFDEIGVVARTLEPFRNAIREVFEADAVPFDMPEAGPLKRYPLARVCIDLLALRKRDFPAHAVSDIVESPYLRPEILGEKLQRRWGRIMDRLAISAGWLVWQGRLKNVDEALPAMKFLSELREALAPAGVKSWGDWSNYALEILTARIAVVADNRALVTPEAEGKAFNQEEHVWNEIVDITRSLASFEPLGEVNWDFFLETWIEKIEAAQLERDRRRGVRVMNAMDARGESFRYLFLIGTQEGFFPRQVREDPLLRDEDRAFLKHPCGYWIGRKLAGYEEERLLFHLLVDSAREKIFAIYSRSDEDGKAQSASIYLRELCRRLGTPLENPESRVPRQHREKLVACEAESLNPREATLRLLDESGDVKALLNAVGSDGDHFAQTFDRLKWLQGGGKAGPMDGLTEPPSEYLKSLLSKGLSPSALDDFGQCPFRFFAKRVLGLDEEEDEAELGDFSASLRGKIYHAILETYYKSKGKLTLLQAAEEIFTAHHWQDVGLYPVVWKAVRAEMEAELKAFVQWDGERIVATGLAPAWFEREIRGRIAVPGLPAGLHGLEFHGVVDRVDLDEPGKRYQIIDYKTRWPKSKGSVAKKVLSGALHQPGIYAELVGAELASWQLEGASVYAIESENEETERLQPYSGQDWARDREAVLSGIAEYAKMIAAGRFPIRPDDNEAMGFCRWCSFSGICRKSHRRSRDRAEVELADSTYLQIHERKPPKA